MSRQNERPAVHARCLRSTPAEAGELSARSCQCCATWLGVANGGRALNTSLPTSLAEDVSRHGARCSWQQQQCMGLVPELQGLKVAGCVIQQGALLCHKPQTIVTNNTVFPNTLSTWSVPFFAAPGAACLSADRFQFRTALSGLHNHHSEPAGLQGLGHSSSDVRRCCKQEGSFFMPCFCVCAMLLQTTRATFTLHTGADPKAVLKTDRLRAHGCLLQALLCTLTLQPHDVPVAQQGAAEAVPSTCRTVTFVYGHTASSSHQWLRRWPPFVCAGLVSSLPAIAPASATHPPQAAGHIQLSMLNIAVTASHTSK